MLRIVSLLLGVVLICGCAIVDIPSYVKDENPYKHTVYASFDDTLDVTLTVLKDFGWDVTRTIKPSVYERGYSLEDSHRRLLILTDMRKTSLFLASRYARINILLSTKSPTETEIELRYMTVNSVMFKSFKSYEKDNAVERMLTEIERRLSK